jgi:hypothetical protein
MSSDLNLQESDLICSESHSTISSPFVGTVKYSYRYVYRDAQTFIWIKISIFLILKFVKCKFRMPVTVAERSEA